MNGLLAYIQNLLTNSLDLAATMHQVSVDAGPISCIKESASSRV